MIAYIVRRILYAIPILIGVNILTFFLFFYVNTPDDMARTHLGARRVTEEQIAKWKRERDYHLPYFYNAGWAEAAVRQISGDPISLVLPVQTVGEYRLVLDVSKPGTGTLVLSARTDSPAGLNPPIEDLAVDLNTPTQTLTFLLESHSTDTPYHPLELRFTPLEGAPLIVMRLHQKESLSFFSRFTETIFWKKSVRYFSLQFGKSDDGRIIGDEILRRIAPSLAVTVPVFLIGILANIVTAMIIAFFRGTYLDFWGVVLCVILMSISILFYVIGGQWLVGKTLRLIPISGYDTGF